MADAAVTQLREQTGHEKWLVHIIPAAIDCGLCYVRPGSLKFTFERDSIKYECRVGMLD